MKGCYDPIPLDANDKELPSWPMSRRFAGGTKATFLAIGEHAATMAIAIEFSIRMPTATTSTPFQIGHEAMPSDLDVFDKHVLMTELDGKAIVVGEKILTAFHCISCNLWRDTSRDRKREPSLDTNPFVRLKTATGELFSTTLEFADPISDLVILGCPDRSQFPNEAKAYADCAPWSAIEVQLEEFTPDTQAHIRNHDGGWIEGATYPIFPNRVSFDAVEKVCPGASGGPVVLEGKLLAVVSNASDEPQNGVYNGVHPLLAKALPRWCQDSF